MSTDKYLTYRGDVKAVVPLGTTLAFVTVHAENQPTALYRLDAEKFSLAEQLLPCGGLALIADGETLWIAGSDGHVYHGTVRAAPTARGPKFPIPPAALALLAGDRLAVLAGSEIAVLARKDGKVLQTLGLPEPGSCLAADPTGQWLVVGTSKGTIVVFDNEDKTEFLKGESQRLHEGAVTALLFEPEELRFLSAGADQKLLLTHARGRLEPEDKGRANNHSDLVTALVWGPGDRFYSGSRDGTVKAWPRVGATKPSTLKDGIGRSVALAVVPIHNRPHLAAACDDNTLRFFLLDAAGKFGDLAFKANDAYALARHELGQDDPRAREAGLKALAGYQDTAAIELIDGQVGRDGDADLRKLAVQLLGESDHARAAKFLEESLGHRDEAVRVTALEGLRRHRALANLEPLQLALRAAKADIGRIAVAALEDLAKRDDQALGLLVKSLNAKTPEVRFAALEVLEKVHDPKSPDADLAALGSKQADMRRAGLIRLFQRQMLGAARVQAALRRGAEDADAAVRHAAFLVSLFVREKLPVALRARDPELHRQLVDLETLGKGADEKKGKLPKAPAGKGNLAEADCEPLLQATASRALDTCLRGARGLAVLGDARAFGLLLQLSREELPQARAEVCRALAALDDPRSINRLRSLLYDPEAAVRDAAFTALAHIHAADPLLAAEAGLNASFEDVRRRGLQALLGQARQGGKPSDPRGRALLIYALNDSFEGVRGEAFKAVLNLQIDGGGPQTLRFALQSVHADVRREVLTEVMARVEEPWAWALLLEFFNDHDPHLRDEAFQFALKKTRELGPLEAGLRSQYVDVRRLSVTALVKRHIPAAQVLLVQALADPEKEVRQLALDSLVGADAQQALHQALASSHADVRVRAARALARHGATDALAPLLALATAPEPPERDRQGDWAALVEAALDGLGELGDGTALPHVIGLLNSKYSAIRRAAAGALMWVALPNHFEALRQTLHHADPQVKYQAALGLAFTGDPTGASLVFSDAGSQHLGVEQRLVAALTLGTAGEDQLAVFLDDAHRTLREQALFLLMLRELKAHQGTPARCLAALSSRLPRVRLTAARALENFADPTAFRQFVTDLVNDRGNASPWQITAETVDTLAELLVHGSPAVRARTAHLTRYLVKEDAQAREQPAESRGQVLGQIANLVVGWQTASPVPTRPPGRDEEAWIQFWTAHSQRFVAEIESLREKAGKHRPVPSQYSREQLLQLAFGAYIGLLREQGASSAAAAPEVVRVRQTALHRMQALASADAGYAQAARPVLVQALGDPNQAVRIQAFEQLQALGMDRAALAADALETGHTDLGVRGLELLTGGTSAAAGQKVLEDAMQSRTDNLSLEAAKLLMKQRGVASVAALALSAAYEETRAAAVTWLAGEYDRDPAARPSLRQALESRYPKVREAAAFALATKKDPAAFAALAKLLGDAQKPERQQQVIDALIALGDPRVPDVLLDRLENDPHGTANAEALLEAAGHFRHPENADRLLARFEKDSRWRGDLFNAVLTVSGFDQGIDDPEEELPHQRWEQEQHRRHSDLLARLFDRCLALNNVDQLSTLITQARWARGHEVDPVLALAAVHSDEDVRRQSVEAIGWRLRKRQGQPDPLFKALQHSDAVTQFTAAEGLARAHRAEGLSILLSAVDFMDDYYLRRRAIGALGELADPRALDTLLRLAGEDGHALQEDAAEAIGHLGQSAKAEEIYRLLERFAKGNDAIARNALLGLRWLNTHAGWQLVRRRAVDPACPFREIAATVLGHNDEPATRDLLLQLLANDSDSDVIGAALASARRLWGSGSLEPDYAVLQNEASQWLSGDDDTDHLLQRICAKGEARRILEILPRCPQDILESLETSLLNRHNLPVAEARIALQSHDEATARLAARILGRAKAKEAAGELRTALDHWRAAWEERRQTMARRGIADERLAAKTTPTLEALLWAAGQVGVGADALRSVAESRPDDPYYRPVRRAAITALVSAKPMAEVLTLLESAVVGDDPEIRVLAADALRRHNPDRAARLAERALADRASFDRLAADGSAVVDTLHQAAAQLHYQGVALPHLVARGDREGLQAVAGNRALPLATRLGAVEGLAMLAREPAEADLAQIGQSAAEDEELRKAAWRALRRSRRRRSGSRRL